jgi:hypothetical protein
MEPVGRVAGPREGSTLRSMVGSMSDVIPRDDPTCACWLSWGNGMTQPQVCNARRSHQHQRAVNCFTNLLSRLSHENVDLLLLVSVCVFSYDCGPEPAYPSIRKTCHSPSRSSGTRRRTPVRVHLWALICWDSCQSVTHVVTAEWLGSKKSALSRC